jgi:multidrug resistance protein MdtO
LRLKPMLKIDTIESASEIVPDGVPLLAELEETVSLMADAFASPEANEAYSLRPRSDWRWFRPDALSNPDHIKFGLKGCLAAGLCYVFYTAVAWPGISTAVVTCLFTALTSIGASRQKQALRMGGAITGAMIAMAAQVFILPHVDSIGGFTLMFIGVTAGAAWIATSTPRLSYFGVQVALAFYVVHLQEFSLQTSLAVARDRIVGILLGLCMMWIVFDQLWGSPAAVAMKREMIATLRRLARFVREPSTTDTRAAVDRIRALRETINAGFDTVKMLGDAVLFEFGPTRWVDLEWRRRFLAWHAPLRLAFLTCVALVKYRLGAPGFQLPPEVGAAHEEFDRELAKRFDNMADRLENAAVGQDALEPALARLEEVSRIHGGPHAIVPLSRRIANLTASLQEKAFSRLNSA